MPPHEAELFQHYRVLRREDGSLWELGRGAMGVTYKAIDANLHSFVALKVINSLFLDKESARERFVREARAAASLRHRNVASVYHLGNDGQSFFYAMEFIDGETVEHLIERAGPQPWPVALSIALQVARALMAAHEKRLVHRDIKPANIMLVQEAGEDALVVKLRPLS
jgi:serine/threonine protein kinase